MRRYIPLALILLGCSLVSLFSARAADEKSTTGVGAAMTEAAERFLAALAPINWLRPR